MGRPTLWLWYCCRCQDGPMVVDHNPDCINCGYQRCGNCRFEKGRKRKDGKGVGGGGSHDPSVQFQGQGERPQAVNQIQGLPERPRRTEKSPSFDIKPDSDATDNDKAEEAERILEAAEGSKSPQTHDEVSDVLLSKGKAKQISHLEQADKAHVTGATGRPRSVSSEDSSCPSNTSHLPSVISVWLDSIQQYQDYPTIARACEELCAQELEDGDGHQSLQKAVASVNVQNTGKSNYTGGKRKSSALDSNQGQGSSAKPKLSAQSSRFFNESLPFACHFSKKNWIIYEPCCSRKFHTIGHLTEHLRRNHKLTCADCWAKFPNSELLRAHMSGGTCQDTGGTPVHELRVPKTHNEGPYKRWYVIWEMLFPELDPPESPYSQRREADVLEAVNIIAMHLPGRLRGNIPDDHIELVMNEFRHLQFNIHNATTEPPNAQLATPSLSSGSVDEGANMVHIPSESDMPEGQSSLYTMTSPYLYPETTLEEQRPDISNSTRSTAEVEHETDYQFVTDDTRTTQTITAPQTGVEWIGVDPGNANHFGNLIPELDVNFEFLDYDEDPEWVALRSARQR